MKKKNDEAFLRSISGTTPLQKKEKVKKIFSHPVYSAKKTNTINIPGPPLLKELEKEKINSFFRIEKSSINKKLKKGRVPIDKRIDLHGFSVLDAENIFLETILSCYKKNLRCLLFITGKGILKKKENISTDNKLYYGKIRNSFFSWVDKPEMQKYILSVEQAGIENGADGAFFVYLRKQKS